MDDPIVAEVHEARRRIWDECNHDLEQLIARLGAAELQHPERLVTVEQVRERALRENVASSNRPSND